MSKATALLLATAGTTGDERQQMIVFPSRAVFRRTLTASGRTRWRHAAVTSLIDWVPGYVNLAKAEPQPMDLSHGPVLIEVTEAEATEAAGGSLARNVTLRHARVMDALDAEGHTPTTDVKGFVEDWLSANTSDDNAWLDRNVHPKGTAKADTPDPDPDPTPAPAPAATTPEPVVTSVGSGWTYPPVRAGYVTRPNGERYKVRTLDGVNDVQVLQDSRMHGEHVFLYGEPGTGKTALVDSSFGTDFVTMLGTEDTEVSDFIGGYTVTGGGKYLWMDGALAEAMERGVPLFIDEIGVIAPKVMTTLYSIMDGRDELRITANPARGTITSKPGFFVVAATNPHAPGVRLSEALTSRFAVHVEVTSDYAVARAMGVPDVLVTAAENLDKRRAGGEISWSPQMRELLRAKAQWEKRSDVFAVRNLIGSAPEDDRGIVGEVLGRTVGKKLKPLAL